MPYADVDCELIEFRQVIIIITIVAIQTFYFICMAFGNKLTFLTYKWKVCPINLY